jgi:glycyl-tRNA synthetase beta chain
LQASADTFVAGALQAGTVHEVQNFVLERLRNQLITQYDRNAVEAVLTLAPPLHQIPARVQAAETFAQSPDAASLAAANKRIGNLLKKVEGALPAVNASLLTEPAEQALAQSIATVQPVAQKQFDSGDYKAALATLAQTRAAVDTFFNDIMVMAEDQAVRLNRLSLLSQLHRLMNQVADISRLAP